MNDDVRKLLVSHRDGRTIDMRNAERHIAELEDELREARAHLADLTRIRDAVVEELNRGDAHPYV